MTVVRRLVLFGGPLVATVAMWSHPHSGEDVYANLLLLAGYDDPLASVARFGAAVYAVFMLGFVATVGITSGLLVRESRALAPAQQDGVAHAVGDLHTEPRLIAAGAVGGLGDLLAVTCIAVVLHRAGAHWAPLALLVGSVVAVGAHSGLAAIVGTGSFVAAVAWLEFRWDAGGPTEPADASASA